MMLPEPQHSRVPPGWAVGELAQGDSLRMEEEYLFLSLLPL